MGRPEPPANEPTDVPAPEDALIEAGIQQERPPAGAQAAAIRLPERIGPYRILRRVGEGGAGVVYEAEQAEPIRRLVAVKVIKPGMDTEQVIARFEWERQALALMEHPGVAKVFDAGMTEQGRPYFAMEYVPGGTTLTEYCDDQQLGIEGRLKLFMETCDAVHHAHQKGIIHRDIKPSNVLVTIQDGKPKPKVIDFGVAKATDHRLTERMVLTEQGRLLGTPGYMSPEQAEPTSRGVDTRSDIYSLGVMLYELLTGAPPFGVKLLVDAAFDEIRRIIQEQEPPKPSTRLSSMSAEHDGSAATVAWNRCTNPQTLIRRIRGDLDWVTMKALGKDPARRYGSAAHFAADLQRYLNHQPVIAGPPRAAYRVRKFVRRNRGLVAAAGASALVLVVTSAVSIRFALSEAEQRRIAEAAEQVAVTEAGKASRTRDFALGLLQANYPDRAKGEPVTARDLLDAAAVRVQNELGETPEIKADVLETIGLAYGSLGLHREAFAQLEQALSLRRGIHLEPHPALASTITSIALLQLDTGELAAAERAFREALDIFQAVYGEEHTEAATAMLNLATALRGKGDYDQAIPLLRTALRINRAAFGEGHPDLAPVLNELGSHSYGTHDYPSAAEYFREALESVRAQHGRLNSNVATSLHNLSASLDAMGNHAEAQNLRREALAICEELFGVDHRATLRARAALAKSLLSAGRLVEAEAQLRDIRTRGRQVLAPEDAVLDKTLALLGRVCLDQKKYAEAEDPLRECLRVQRSRWPDGHRLVSSSLKMLGESLMGQGKYAEAEAAFLDAHEVMQKTQHVAPSQMASVLEQIAHLYEVWGKPDEATKWRARLRAPASTAGAEAP